MNGVMFLLLQNIISGLIKTLIIKDKIHTYVTGLPSPGIGKPLV
jgi:uncharacterized membrane protein YraQ (UPF0718 family)